jgi:Na+(H+)/acetate symporter ActP
MTLVILAFLVAAAFGLITAGFGAALTYAETRRSFDGRGAIFCLSAGLIAAVLAGTLV